MNQPALATLYCLSQICQALESAPGDLTLTRLKRTYEFDPATLAEAIEHGCAKKVLSRRKGNILSFRARFEVPEEAYYPAIQSALKAMWLSEKYEQSEFYLENTSRRDSRIAGPWTRPDFTVVSHKKFPWTIGVEFDVVTFEVKREDSCNVLAVFEALSHVSVATRAYIVFPFSEQAWEARDAAQAQRVRDECLRHGVGLILIDGLHSLPHPVHLIRAQRKEIDHQRCSNFLSAVMSEKGKAHIAAWK